MRRPDPVGAATALPSFDPYDDDFDGVSPPDTLGARLRAARERRKISIASIAESTKILGALLEAMEQGDVSRWPTGLYRRAFIRAYAQAIGLDPEPIVREFIEQYPDPEDVPATPQATVPAAPAARPPRTLRLHLAEYRWSFSPSDLIDEIRRRVSAVALDAFVIGVTGLILFLVFGSFWAPVAVTAAVYYFGSILVIGNTPGIFVFGPRSRNNANLALWAQSADRIASRIREIFHLPERKEPIERTTP